MVYNGIILFPIIFPLYPHYMNSSSIFPRPTGEIPDRADVAQDLLTGAALDDASYREAGKPWGGRYFPWFFWWVPSGYVKIAIENGHRNSGFSH